MERAARNPGRAQKAAKTTSRGGRKQVMFGHWMRRVALILLATALPGAVTSLAAQPDAPSVARFAWISYAGEDGPPPLARQYRNPILAGFYPDPSVLRVGRDYYLVNSTFTWFPGLPIFHSRDLVSWRPIGNAIDRPGQFDFTGLAVSRGIFAPDLSFHNGRYFLVGTCVDCGGNFVMTARNPAGPWSKPVWLKTVEGIDPALFFDDDGRAWLINNRAPEGTPLYDGHRALWIEQFDPVTLTMMGNPKLVVNGGIDLSKKPVWIEGPHIYKVGGQYYLSAAEGGTSVNHSQVILRADKVDGPYVPAPPSVNPILTQRDLDPTRPNPITSAGHADLVQMPSGKWAAVFLATRPYRGNLYNIGRETYLLPVTWRDGWPIILDKGKTIPTSLPRIAGADRPSAPQTGSFSWREDFNGPRLGMAWMTMRGAGVRVAGGELLLEARRDGIGDLGKPALAARRQQHAVATVTTSLAFSPREGESAGFAAIQNDDYFLTIALTRREGKLLVRVARRAGKSEPREGVTVAEKGVAGTGPVGLRIRARDGLYSFDMQSGGKWVTVAADVDATNLSTEIAGGFVGTMIGPFAQGGEASVECSSPLNRRHPGLDPGSRSLCPINRAAHLSHTRKAGPRIKSGVTCVCWRR
jgi:alpha-N-arabinofuranosidase